MLDIEFEFVVSVTALANRHTLVRKRHLYGLGGEEGLPREGDAVWDLEGWVGVCHSAAWRSSYSLEVFIQKLNGHLSKVLQEDYWGGRGLATLVTSTALPNPKLSNRAKQWDIIELTYMLPSINISLPQFFASRGKWDSCQPQKGLHQDREDR